MWNVHRNANTSKVHKTYSTINQDNSLELSPRLLPSHLPSKFSNLKHPRSLPTVHKTCLTSHETSCGLGRAKDKNWHCPIHNSGLTIATKSLRSEGLYWRNSSAFWFGPKTKPDKDGSFQHFPVDFKSGLSFSGNGHDELVCFMMAEQTTTTTMMMTTMTTMRMFVDVFVQHDGWWKWWSFSWLQSDGCHFLFWDKY